MHRIEVALKKHLPDFAGEGIIGDISDLGFKPPEHVRTAFVYLLDAKLTKSALQNIAGKLLADPVIEDYSIDTDLPNFHSGKGHRVWVFRKPGVMDPSEASVVKGISDLGFKVNAVRTAKKFFFSGGLSEKDARNIALKAIANEVIEEVHVGPWKEPSFFSCGEYKFKPTEIALRDYTDKQLVKLSADRQLYLSLGEMKAIQTHFRSLKRNPTDAELETLAQTWSEHCCHKTLKGRVVMDGKVIKNLLKATVMKVTSDLKRPWCVSVFEDNAGIIEFDKNFDVCFKVETHNHPSAIEPYGGAGTGIGGVIRDILGTGLGAKPVMNTDVFCFGLPDMPRQDVPPGALHPRRVMKGVVRGVRDYGNRMGIPTANGAVFFDPRYTGNPLVYCGTVGLIPRDKCKKATKSGDVIVVAGGRTGRDGIHGATFSSGELTTESETVSSGAVQIGNPIEEKKVTDVLLQARDLNLYNCITDCGAGGLSSAIGEMGADTGAEVHLDKVPLKYHGLNYDEIWISEAQERMVFAVPAKKVQTLIKLFASENVEATAIGTFTKDKRLKLFYNNHKVADLEMQFVHKGVPDIERQAVWKKPKFAEPNFKSVTKLGQDLKKILSSWNVCSKEWIIRQYDHEVQGASVLKPLQGVSNDGPGDACVLAPVLGSKKGLAVSNGMNPRYGDIDPYHMAAAAIDEAVRNIIAVGGNLDRIALLDNFAWGNCNKPEIMGALVRACQACYDVAKVYRTPFISGKDSLNNEFNTGKETIVIPHTLLISAIGVVEDITKSISMDAKTPGNFVYVVGQTKNELGGSHFYMVRDFIGNSVPQCDPKSAKTTFEKLSKAMAKGLVRSCHDLSEGGLAVALAEMAFAGGWGITAELADVPRTKDVTKSWQILFSESLSRFIVEVTPGQAEAFEKALSGVPVAKIGVVTAYPSLTIKGTDGAVVIDENIEELKNAWQKTLKW